MLFNKIVKYCLFSFLAMLLITPLANSQPVPITTDSRLKTLVYNENEVYQLKFHYGYQSFVEFSEDEEIEMISMGESFSWRITPAGKRLFIRPLEIAAHTNMIVITNKRTYQFDIRSGEYDENGDEELVYTVRFYYPDLKRAPAVPSRLSRPNLPPVPPRPPVPGQIQSGFPAPPAALQTPRDKNPDIKVSGRLPENVLAASQNGQSFNYQYDFAGSATNIIPTKIYDDGLQTFMQFKNDNLIIPSVSVVDFIGNEHLLNYEIKSGHVVLDGVHRQLTLRLADSLICVFNNKML